MAVGKGLDRLSHIGLHVELLMMADENMVVGLSDKQIAARLGIGKNKIGPMIDWLHQQKMVYRFGANHGQGTKQGYRNIRVYPIPVKGTGFPVKGTGSGYEIPVKGTHLTPHDPMVLHEKKKREIVADEPRQSAADKPRRSLDDSSKKREIYESEHWRMLWDMYPHRADLDEYEQANCVAWLAANLERVGGWKGPYFDRILDYINRKPDDFPAHKLSKLLRDDKIKPLEAWPNP